MERKLYLKWYKLYFNDILVDERMFSNSYYYDVPNEEPRVCKTCEQPLAKAKGFLAQIMLKKVLTLYL